MMKHILGYRCTLCGAELPYDERMTCPHCGEKGILDIVFDYNYIKKSFGRAALAKDRTNSMWRYAPLMPLEPRDFSPFLRVGWTPLYTANRLSAELGLKTLYLKDDGLNPTASLAVNLRTALDTLPPADNTVTDAQVLVAASPVTLVPLAHFREEDCAALYGYCFPESQGCEVYYDVLPMANAVLLFALQRQLARTLEDAFGSVHYVSALTPLMRHFADKSSQGGQRLYAYAAEGRLHLSVFEGGRLLMANSYRMQAPTDAAYYLLNMARRTGTDPQTATFYVAGSSDLRDAILGELRKYVRQVNAIHPAAEFNRHPVVRNKQVPYDLACFLLEMS